MRYTALMLAAALILDTCLLPFRVLLGAIVLTGFVPSRAIALRDLFPATAAWYAARR